MTGVPPPVPISSATIGPLLIGVLIVTLAVSVLRDDCVCAQSGDCFCLNESNRLHDVTESELHRLPDQTEAEYRHFLNAWETEYELRLREWAQLYADFQQADQPAEAQKTFESQLFRAHDEFVTLFRQRHSLYRAERGIE